MKKVLLGIVTMCVCAAASHAGDAGVTAAQFLSIRPGARSAGMGQTGVAEARDATALYWNPAGLASGTRPELNLTHMEYLEGLRYDYAAYVYPQTGFGAIGVGVIALYSDPISRATESSAGAYQATDQTFTTMESALVLGWGVRIGDGLTVGLGAKSISQRFDSVTAHAVAFDAGAGVVISDAVRLGAAVRNLGTQIAEHDLPTETTLGCSINIPNKKLVLALDADMPFNGPPAIGAGIEKKISRTVTMREGYTTRAETSGLSGISVGLGVAVQRFMVDYGFGLYGHAGGTHMLSINYAFSARRVATAKVHPYTVDVTVPGRNVLMFEKLPRHAAIEIINDTDVVVMSITPGARRTAQWNGIDSRGARVAAGMYRYVITDRSGNRKTGAFRIAK